MFLRISSVDLPLETGGNSLLKLKQMGKWFDWRNDWRKSGMLCTPVKEWKVQAFAICPREMNVWGLKVERSREFEGARKKNKYSGRDSDDKRNKTLAAGGEIRGGANDKGQRQGSVPL